MSPAPHPSPALRRASIPILLLAACAPTEDAKSPARGAAVVPADAVYAGEIVLRGDPAGFAAGSATIAIVPAGEDAPLLARSWDLGDHAWRPGTDGWRLYFSLDARDAWPGASGTFAPEMDLVARFDPDGNPATEELGVARMRVPVRSGSRDLAVELPVGRQVAAHSAANGN